MYQATEKDIRTPVCSYHTPFEHKMCVARVVKLVQLASGMSGSHRWAGLGFQSSSMTAMTSRVLRDRSYSP